MSRIFISAAHKSSGKTTVSIGLCAALREMGKQVQPFKKGPDYIDPMWLGKAAGRSCHNLDFFTMNHQEIQRVFQHYQHDADIALIEGNKGLYDGLDLDGSNSNAALATLLKAPVILVIDARGMTRGIAPLILGYQAFDKEVNIAGVILNQLGGSRHESKLRNVIEHYTDLAVLGAVHRNPDMEIVERHLGLIPSNESDDARNKIKLLGEVIARQVDLDKLLGVAASAPALAHTPAPVQSTPKSTTVRIGIAKDAAFGFYYPDDLDAFAEHNAQLVPIDMINDKNLPAIDGLFIGGGFPETHMVKLEQNVEMRQQIKSAIENGLPCYAECGGLMYLAQQIRWNHEQHEMVGVLPGTITMHAKPQGRGYIRITQTDKAPWSMNVGSNEICAHEFHYSSLDDLPTDLDYAFNVTRGAGIDGKHDGIVYKNMLACYAHLRNTEQSPWVENFINFVRQQAR